MNDGGPAFPEAVSGLVPTGGPGWASETSITRLHPGMSVRDYMAAAALTGLCSLGAGMFGKCLSTRTAEENSQDNFDQMAVMAIRFADAMLKARGQK